MDVWVQLHLDAFDETPLLFSPPYPMSADKGEKMLLISLLMSETHTGKSD